MRTLLEYPRLPFVVASQRGYRARLDVVRQRHRIPDLARDLLVEGGAVGVGGGVVPGDDQPATATRGDRAQAGYLSGAENDAADRCALSRETGRPSLQQPARVPLW